MKTPPLTVISSEMQQSENHWKIALQVVPCPDGCIVHVCRALKSTLVWWDCMGELTQQSLHQTSGSPRAVYHLWKTDTIRIIIPWKWYWYQNETDMFWSNMSKIAIWSLEFFFQTFFLKESKKYQFETFQNTYADTQNKTLHTQHQF